jgi:hypothetical protein
MLCGPRLLPRWLFGLARVAVVLPDREAGLLWVSLEGRLVGGCDVRHAACRRIVCELRLPMEGLPGLVAAEAICCGTRATPE